MTQTSNTKDLTEIKKEQKKWKRERRFFANIKAEGDK